MYTLIFCVIHIYVYIQVFFKKKKYVPLYPQSFPVRSRCFSFPVLLHPLPERSSSHSCSAIRRPRGFEEFFAKLARDPLVQAGPGRTLDGLISEKNMIKLENKRVQGDRSKTKLFVFSAPSTAMKIQAAFVFFANKHAEFANMSQHK